MTTERHKTHEEPRSLRAIFNAAMEFDGVDERSAYLVRVCAGNAALRQRIECLLRAHHEAGVSWSPEKPLRPIPH